MSKEKEILEDLRDFRKLREEKAASLIAQSTREKELGYVGDRGYDFFD